MALAPEGFNSTMKRILLASALVASAFLAQISAQDQREIFYAESFRQGGTEVKEESFEAKLDSQSGVGFALPGLLLELPTHEANTT
jgi:hypothetical protein